MKFLNLTRDILTIVQDDLELDFKDESIDYRRFMTHLKFFIQRAVKRITATETTQRTFTMSW